MADTNKKEKKVVKKETAEDRAQWYLDRTSEMLDTGTILGQDSETLKAYKAVRDESRVNFILTDIAYQVARIDAHLEQLEQNNYGSDNWPFDSEYSEELVEIHKHGLRMEKTLLLNQIHKFPQIKK